MLMSKEMEMTKKNLEKHFKKSKNSILSFGFIKDNETYFYNYNHDNINAQETFGIGSISKTFVGSYIAKLIQNKKINLDKRMDDYLDLNSKIHYPTIRELATHSSGYSFFIPRYQTLKVMFFSGFNKNNIYKGIGIDWVNKYLNHHKPKKKKKYIYSDFNYVVLSLIIEKIEGKPYKEVMQEFILNEVGLKETGYYNLDLSINDQYSWNWEDDNPFTVAGGMYSTVNDMLKFLQYQSDINNQYLDISHTKNVNMLHTRLRSGFSWCSFDAGTYFWHIGGQGYYRSYALFDKEKQIFVVVLATVDINIQHVNRIGSQLFRNVRKDHNKVIDCLSEFNVNEV